MLTIKMFGIGLAPKNNNTLTKLLQDKKVNVTTEDIAKFVSIVNIDRLVEENPELPSYLSALTVDLNDKAEISAFGLLVNYIIKTQREKLTHLKKSELNFRLNLKQKK